MKRTLILENPILVNNVQVKELTYDPIEITAAQFSEACGRSAALDKTKSFTFKFKENDYALHLYLGMMAVVAVNPGIDVSDLERVKGFDTLALTDIGMLFTLRRSGAASGAGSLEKPSENTPDTTPPVS